MVAKKPQSKRIKASHRYKIIKRVKEHHRKEKKIAKKNPKSNKPKKDPGIPNSWPFKEELLNEIERAKQEAEAEKAKQKLARQEEKAKQKLKEQKQQQKIKQQHQQQQPKQQPKQPRQPRQPKQPKQPKEVKE
ncbi:GNL3L/Grn1 putative GTPase-domain-containing protein [Spinellus fusiger]|nr:GNL3L/Grn1 putative GTPase-domain-containing protein [Spinellus fusiger]